MTFEDSMPRRRGMEGPVRSMSSIPTVCPDRERDRPSWVVMEDFPTPPLPERTFFCQYCCIKVNRRTYKNDVFDFVE